MTITAQTIITISAVLAALFAILKYYNRGYDFVKRQNQQDAEIAELKAEQARQIAEVKAEQAIAIRGILACLKGMHEQGANGPVTAGIAEIEDYLNRKAHE